MNSRTFLAGVATLVVAALVVARGVAGSTSGLDESLGDAQKSPDRAPPHQDAFVEMDLDRDGRVSAVEFASSPESAIARIAAGKRYGPAGITGGFDLFQNEGKPGRSQFFKRLDTDGDGYITRDEFAKNSGATTGSERARK